jgi:dienelactone hydrolase
MTAQATELDYYDGELLCKGTYYREESRTPLPIVLVTPAWDGVVEEVHEKARRLAEAGYIALVVDVYGGGKTLTDMAQMMPAVESFMVDRTVLVRRMQAAVAAAKTIPDADSSNIAAMGYCFGGLCVLDLARGGGDQVKGVISFHGALMAADPPIGEPIAARVLVLHGEDDPLVPPQQVEAFKQEMTAAGVDWQLHAYGGTVHAFTRTGANDPASGAVYSEAADRRSWLAMLNFLEELFTGVGDS